MVCTMKKIIVGIVLCSVFIFISFISLMIGLFLFAPDLNSVEYYIDDANYDSFECTVRSYDIYDNAVYIYCDHSRDNYYDKFKISGKNFNLAMNNGLSDLLQENANFLISSADAYLGDGWSYPIVALTHNGDEIIPYAEGKQNFVEYQQEAENLAIKYFQIAGVVFVALIVIETCLIILYIKKRKDRQFSE